MAKSLRLSEKWFNRALWLVAIIFAGFLIGLGGLVVDNFALVEAPVQREDFVDKVAATPIRAQIDAAQDKRSDAKDALDRENLLLEASQGRYASARETFSNWVATRQATSQPGQDSELIARTAALDALKLDENAATKRVEIQRQAMLDAEQGEDAARRRLETVEAAAQGQYDAAAKRSELRIFGYRLALTLPLLVIAGWLFVRQRASRWWPFVWGFILFALFGFFVELVPYLPSYGGYVRYIVGTLLTVLIGRYAIVALGRYLEQQKLAEAQPDRVRREELSYDTALSRLAKNVCAGCERPVDLKNPEVDFCPHCGIGLFDHCPSCTARKNAFAPFCHACGVAAAKAP